MSKWNFEMKWKNKPPNHVYIVQCSNIHLLLKDKDCGHVDIAQWSVLFEDIKRFDELKSRVMSLSKVRAWQYYLWHICALFCCVEASLVSVWSGQTCKETLRCIQCPLTEMVSSLIILVSLRGNCSGKKESLADQFGLHCSITQIRGNRPELGRLSVISSSSSLHWYILCSLNMPALTQTIIITTYCCKMVVSSRDLTRRLANIIKCNCNKRKKGRIVVGTLKSLCWENRIKVYVF